MDRAPLFGRPEQFDRQRISQSDIDGTGTTDRLLLLTIKEPGTIWARTKKPARGRLLSF